MHGGLTFGGGPISNYMTHAVVATVQGRIGLLFGKGVHCTYNHTIVISRDAPKGELICRDYDCNDLADKARGAIPPLGDDYQGEVCLESYTVAYDRGGQPAFGIVMARSPDGGRVAAKVDKADARSIAFFGPLWLTAPKASLDCGPKFTRQGGRVY